MLGCLLGCLGADALELFRALTEPNLQIEIYESRQKKANETRAIKEEQLKVKQQREFAEKYLGVKHKMTAADIAAALKEKEEHETDGEKEEAEEEEAPAEPEKEPEARGAKPRTATLHRALRDVAPRVAGLTIAGAR